MTDFYGANMSSILENPPADGEKLEAAKVGPKVRCFVETVTLTSAINTDGTSASLFIARLPKNSRFLKTEVISGVSLGTSKLAITDGTTTFAAAKAYGTTADATVVYGDGDEVGDEVTEQTDLKADVSTAALPSSGEVKFVTYFADLN